MSNISFCNYNGFILIFVRAHFCYSERNYGWSGHDYRKQLSSDAKWLHQSFLNKFWLYHLVVLFLPKAGGNRLWLSLTQQ